MRGRMRGSAVMPGWWVMRRPVRLRVAASADVGRTGWTVGGCGRVSVRLGRAGRPRSTGGRAAVGSTESKRRAASSPQRLLPAPIQSRHGARGWHERRRPHSARNLSIASQLQQSDSTCGSRGRETT